MLLANVGLVGHVSGSNKVLEVLPFADCSKGAASDCVNVLVDRQKGGEVLGCPRVETPR